MSTFTKSEIFKAYNAIKRTISRSQPLREGGRYNHDKQIERANRALGLLMRYSAGNYELEYITTARNCECDDSQYRREYTCKHRLLVLMIEQINSQRQFSALATKRQRVNA